MTLLPCPRCRCQPTVQELPNRLHQVTCPSGCVSITDTAAHAIDEWNTNARARRLAADFQRIANHCKNETQIPDVDGPTTFELAWDAIQSYQVRIVWWHHDGGIDENDAAGATPEEAIGYLATQLKRSTA